MLDTLIVIKDNKFNINLYDKRDDFNFNINSFPHTSSNINIKTAINVYTSQLVRIARIITDIKDFHIKHKQLTNKLRKNGFIKSQLINKFKQFTINHTKILKKWGHQPSHNSQYIKQGFE